jgi:hypothetical protein
MTSGALHPRDSQVSSWPLKCLHLNERRKMRKIKVMNIKCGMMVPDVSHELDIMLRFAEVVVIEGM